MIKSITVHELKEKLKDDSVVLLDVREPFEHKQSNIKEAVLIPLGEITVDVLPDLKKTYIIHCRSGSRSYAACQKLLEEDPTLDLYNLEGGIMAWDALKVKSDAQCSIKKPISKVWPLERQVLFIAGMFVFISIILGTFMSTSFYMFSAFIGMGLMFAGFTGKCTMMKILAYMPWNK